MEFNFNITAAAVDYTNAISAIVQFCIESQDTEFIYSFHPDGFPSDDSDSIIILRGEYEIIMSLINAASSQLKKMNSLKSLHVWDGYDFDKYITYRTAIISAKGNSIQ